MEIFYRFHCISVFIVSSRMSGSVRQCAISPLHSLSRVNTKVYTYRHLLGITDNISWYIGGFCTVLPSTEVILYYLCLSCLHVVIMVAREKRLNARQHFIHNNPNEHKKTAQQEGEKSVRRVFKKTGRMLWKIPYIKKPCCIFSKCNGSNVEYF